MVGKIISGVSSFVLIMVIYVNSAYGIDRMEFKSIDSFIKSFKKAEIGYESQGDLMGKGRADWAGLILLGDEEEKLVQIYILEKLESRHYAVVEKSHPRPAFGGAEIICLTE